MARRLTDDEEDFLSNFSAGWSSCEVEYYQNLILSRDFKEAKKYIQEGTNRPITITDAEADRFVALMSKSLLADKMELIKVENPSVKNIPEWDRLLVRVGSSVFIGYRSKDVIYGNDFKSWKPSQVDEVHLIKLT